ncbi:SDR family NAD(P)-dependent oxidoreductase [Amycolatopsis jejuensis]|uniref:SDR family NAD(P)-dependent oxidoreductase n=1 Tax=Amycolatopsis jejuensis TaxID=330084 RepID=UPI000690F685|nr:SDR family NAD(P)-dependent oxidoreductase [Amycolatopsis jejuensis]
MSGGRLAGRVAIVTGSGRGLGRAHALELARHGAAVVVNDVEAAVDGTRDDAAPAAGAQVVEEIRRNGGRAALSGHDVADWPQALEMIDLAVHEFGDLHVLVNNAGIVRDRALVTMAESDWDEVVRVHLKGHAAPTHHAMNYWREQAKNNRRQDRSVVMTSSLAAFVGNFGQANYSSAKLAVLGLSHAVAIEGERYGVRSNTVSPAGRTRIAATVQGAEDAMRPEPGKFDQYDPANVSPLIAWLADARCPAQGQVYQVVGRELAVTSLPVPRHRLTAAGRWDLDRLDAELPGKLIAPSVMTDWFTPDGGGDHG